MTQFGQGNIAPAQRRSEGEGLRTGITESLNAPGVQTVPDVSPGQSIARQMQQALSITGQLADTIHQHNQFEEREQKSVDQALKGQGFLEARTDLTRYSNEIETWGLDFFADKGTDEEIATSLIDATTKGFEQAHIDGHMQILPQLTAMVAQQRDAQEEQNRLEFARPLINSLHTAKNVEDVEQVIDGLSKLWPQQSRHQNVAMILPVIDELAQEGKTRLVSIASRAIGLEDYSVETERLFRKATRRAEEIEWEGSARSFDALNSLVRSGQPVELIENEYETLKGDLHPQHDRSIQALMEAYKQGVIQQNQAENLLQTDTDIFHGRWIDGDPLLTIADIADRTDLPRDDDRWISPQQAELRVNKVGEKLEFDVRERDAFTVLNGGDGRLMTSDDDRALMSVMQKLGIIEGSLTPSGSITLEGIPNKADFAHKVDLANRVPAPIQRQLAVQMDGDLSDVQDAGESIIALYKQRPEIAYKAMSEMSRDAKAKAHYLISRIHFSAQPWLDSNVMSIKHQDWDQATIDRVAWKDAASLSHSPGRQDAKIQSMAVERIQAMKGLDDTEIRADQLEFYIELVEEHVGYQLQFVATDEIAFEMAHRSAEAAFLLKYPPVQWGGETFLSNSSYVPPETFKQDVIDDLKAEGMGESIISAVENGTPEWVESEGQWGFRDSDNLPVEIPAGSDSFGNQRLLVDPYSSMEILELEAQRKVWMKRHLESKPTDSQGLPVGSSPGIHQIKQRAQANVNAGIEARTMIMSDLLEQAHELGISDAHKQAREKAQRDGSSIHEALQIIINQRQITDQLLSD